MLSSRNLRSGLPKTLLAMCLLVSSPSFADDLVAVTGGVVAGTTSDDLDVRIFKGVPFAAPPVGELRWRAPQPVPEWDSVFRADTWGTRCVQGDMFGPLVTRDTQMGEDCLYLNVWTPATSPDEKLPVLVVFHGGGFAAGSSSEPRTDGEWFARQDIVVVALSHIRSLQPRPTAAVRATTVCSIRLQHWNGCATTSPPSEATLTTSRSMESPPAPCL